MGFNVTLKGVQGSSLGDSEMVQLCFMWASSRPTNNGILVTRKDLSWQKILANLLEQSMNPILQTIRSSDLVP